jgi:hypothetical protein
MFSGSFFGLGAMLPILSILLGYVVVGSSFSVAAIVVTLRVNSTPVAQIPRQRTYGPIGILVCSEILTIVGAWLIPNELSLGIMLICIGFFVLWPASAAFAIWQRGIARKTLLVGHGIIAVWTCIMVLTIVMHKLDVTK